MSDNPMFIGAEEVLSASVDIESGAITPSNSKPPAPGDTGSKSAPPATPPLQTLEIGAKPAGPRPAWLPAKFKSEEDMARAYGELESRLGQTAAPAKPAAPAKAAEAPAGILPITDAEFAAYTNEVVANGGRLSDASYSALAARGISRQVTDDYIQGQQARSQIIRDSTMAEVGGEEQYAAISEWAVTNMDPNQLAVFNAEVNSGNPARVQFAVRGLKAQFVAAGNTITRPSTQRVTGRSPGGLPPARFENMEQQVAAQRDPRYQRDSAFRQKVMEMIAASQY